MRPISIDNLHALDLKLERTETTIEDNTGIHKRADEIILYVPDASNYETDFIQNDCAMLHFSAQQAKALAWKLLKLVKKISGN